MTDKPEVEKNIRLVNKVLSNTVFKDFLAKTNEYDYEDLYQEGCIALCQAANTYDGDKSKFSTYAYRCITNALLNIVKLANCDKRRASIDAMSLDDEDSLIAAMMPQAEDRYDMYYEELKKDILSAAGNQPEILQKVIKLLIQSVEEDRKIIELCQEYNVTAADVQNQKKKLKKIFNVDRLKTILYN